MPRMINLSSDREVLERTRRCGGQHRLNLTGVFQFRIEPLSPAIWFQENRHPMMNLNHIGIG